MKGLFASVLALAFVSANAQIGGGVVPNVPGGNRPSPGNGPIDNQPPTRQPRPSRPTTRQPSRPIPSRPGNGNGHFPGNGNGNFPGNGNGNFPGNGNGNFPAFPGGNTNWRPSFPQQTVGSNQQQLQQFWNAPQGGSFSQHNQFNPYSRYGRRRGRYYGYLNYADRYAWAYFQRNGYSIYSAYYFCTARQHYQIIFYSRYLSDYCNKIRQNYGYYQIPLFPRAATTGFSVTSDDASNTSSFKHSPLQETQIA
uniref:Uncharacterized protein n=1 Tax=Rhabditophanes sp. KR3021 TaxID=114890 RepID=A0AC35TJR1_9BILA